MTQNYLYFARYYKKDNLITGNNSLELYQSRMKSLYTG